MNSTWLSSVRCKCASECVSVCVVSCELVLVIGFFVYWFLLHAETQVSFGARNYTQVNTHTTIKPAKRQTTKNSVFVSVFGFELKAKK